MCMEKRIRTLTIDPEFKNLIRPLFKQEYLQLEENIIADGCRDPITVWNGTIVDGHNRYEICMRHQIPFAVEEISFDCKEEAIAWICANQLGRRNLTEETRKFLIGMQYESEKVITARRNVLGINQYPSRDPEGSPERPGIAVYNPQAKIHTSKKIAEKNHISHGTVEKYAAYTRALEEIGKKEPDLVPKILSGRYKISHNNILELAQRPASEIKKINARLERDTHTFAKYQVTRKEIQGSKSGEDLQLHSIKDMPKYDPDAEVAGLTLTIPSWISSLSRTKSKADFETISSNAKEKLQLALYDLNRSISDLLSELKES